MGYWGDQRQFIVGIHPIRDDDRGPGILYDEDEDEGMSSSWEEDNDEEGLSGGDEDDQVEKTKPTEAGGGTGNRNSDPNKRNKKRCLDLEAQLEKELNLDKWAISLKLKIHDDYIVITDDEYMEGRRNWVMTSVDVSLEGDVLDKLRSLMLYQIHGGWLKMKLEAKLSSLFTNPDPRVMDDAGVGGCVHVNYEATNVKLKNRPFSHNGCTVLFEPHTKAPPKSSDMGMATAAGTTKMMLESGLDADLKIIGGNAATVPCHSGILLVRYPVIAAKFSGRFESDANKERRIELREWSKEEITAFLEYVYYGGTKKAVENPSLATAVFEIGLLHLLVPEVEQAMEEILLTRPSEWFSVDAGLELYLLWMKYERTEFQRKARDVLAIRTDEEINSSELFDQVFPRSDLREEFMTSRKRF